jgi:hypothetical protein
MFDAEQVPDALEILGWYDDEAADEVHRAVLALSKGDLDVLLGLVGAAVRDFTDVLLWASLPEPTPEERAATLARVDALTHESGEARHRYLVARFGVTGAEQIERSNQNLLGVPRRPQGHTDSAGAG